MLVKFLLSDYFPVHLLANSYDETIHKMVILCKQIGGSRSTTKVQVSNDKITSKQGYHMLRLFVISSFLPLSNCWSMKHNNSKIWIQKKDSVSSNGSNIKENWLWSGLKRVRYQGRLNHHNRIGYIFSVQNHSEICCFIWAVVKNLKSQC